MDSLQSPFLPTVPSRERTAERADDLLDKQLLADKVFVQDGEIGVGNEESRRPEAREMLCGSEKPVKPWSRTRGPPSFPVWSS